MYNFVNYYHAVQKTYKFRIKSAMKIGDEQMDAIERVLSKYRPEKITQPKKMMFQTMPLGFVGIENAEIWFVDATLTVPARSETLAYDLRQNLGLVLESPMIMVTGEYDDPTQDQIEAEEDQEDAKQKGALLTQSDYPEAPKVDSTKLFGDAYNANLVSYLKKLEAERGIGKKIDAPHPITKWAKQPEPNADLPDTSNFNDVVGVGNKHPFTARKK